LLIPIATPFSNLIEVVIDLGNLSVITRLLAST
jgi:hypothetical protein